MDANIYLKCIDSLGYASGNAVGLYDFKSGDYSATYNLIYPTGDAYKFGVFNANAVPLERMDLVAITGNFTGDACYRVGYLNERPEWSVILDLENSLYCSASLSGNKTMILNTFTDFKGFGIYLSDSHQLCAVASTNVFVNPKVSTITKEVPQKALIYAGFDSGNSLNYGFYDLENESLVSRSINIEDFDISSNRLFIGGMFEESCIPASASNPTGYPSGYVSKWILGQDFSGKMYDMAFFADSLSESEADICFGCLFAKSIGSSVPTGLVNVQKITGYKYSIVYEAQITGYSTGIVYDHDNNELPANFFYSNPLTGQVAVREQFAPLTTTVSTAYTGQTVYYPVYDTAKKTNRLKYDVNFYTQFDSSDRIVIYTYDAVNRYVNNKVSNFKREALDGFQYQLWGNGLLETLDVDYTVDEGYIKNFDTTDRLLNDYTSGQSIIVDYSGWWERGKIWINSGSGGTKKYYPTTGLFPEGTSGEIYITGINNRAVHNAYDLYLDGQQLIYGVSYSTGFYSGRAAVILSGADLPDFIADVYYFTGGNVSGIFNEESAELIFYPKENSPNYYKYENQPTGYVITGVKGYDPQIWINGVRQFPGFDFQTVYTCSLTTGFDRVYGDTSFLVFNNENDIFDLI